MKTLGTAIILAVCSLSWMHFGLDGLTLAIMAAGGGLIFGLGVGR